MKLKWIIIDSLMFRHLKHAPFLRSVAKEYKADFIPLLGYQEDGLSFFSGKKPSQINVGALFCYSPKTSLFSWLKLFKNFKFLDLTFLKYVLITLSHFLKKESHLGKFNIPVNLISNFDIGTHALESNNYVLKVETIFDDYIKQNKSFAFIKGALLTTDKGNGFNKNFFRNLFCRGDEKTLKLAQKYKDKDLSVVWFLQLDSISHKFGPDSREVADHVQKIDKWIADYLRGEKFIIHSDHGMAKIENEVDVLKVINQTPFKMGKDYLVFLDSTMARFWFFNPHIFVVFKEKLGSLGMGHFLTHQEKIEFGYDFADNRYGDEFFVLDEGSIILPNYFQKKAPKGMHGYLPKGDQIGIFLSNLELPQKNEILYNEILDLIS